MTDNRIVRGSEVIDSMSGSRQETRSTRRRQVERLVASGMDVAQWCELNKVSKPALYNWMRVFRDEEPELFGGEEVAHAGDGHRKWYEHVRKAMRASTAIEPAGASGLAAAAPAFAVVDTASISAGPGPSAGAAAPITVRFRGVEVDVPAGSARSDVDAVLGAVAAL